MILTKILNYYKKQNYPLEEVNICYLEGCNAIGVPNDDRLNWFNDRRIVFTPKEVLGNWSATTEPSRFYTINPMNRKGAARIAFGYWRAWKVGIHGNSEPHEALVQVAPISVHRDLNKDGIRPRDKIDTGLFGINQHHGYDMPIENIGKASAGCLVGRTREGHREFMRLVKQVKGYKENRSYLFGTTIIDATKL